MAGCGAVALALCATGCTSGSSTATTSGPTTTLTHVSTQPLVVPMKVLTSGTPTGWVPVDWGRVQISVPASWSVEFGVMFCRGEGSAVELGATKGTTANCNMYQKSSSPSTVHMFGTAASGAGRRTQVNGLPVVVFPAPTGELDYGIPGLREEVDAAGPLARRIIDTLTVSPRAVLWTSPPPVVPSSWKTIAFDGIAARVPASWPVETTRIAWAFFEPCGGNGVWSGEPGVVLDTDRIEGVTYCYAEWPGMLWPVSVPVDHLGIDSTTSEPGLAATAHCAHNYGLDVCALGGWGSVLNLRVTESDGRDLVVTISLAGSGLVARTIMFSLRPAPVPAPAPKLAPKPAPAPAPA